MFNTGFRGKRASDGTGIINPQEQFVQNKYPVPTITSWSISGSDDDALDPAGGQTVLINGGGFVSGCAVSVNGITVTPVTVVSPNQISFISPANSGGSYTLIVYNSTGGGAILVPGLVYSSVPTYTTAQGSIGSGYETTSLSTSVVATSDSTITYAVTSGALPSGASMTSGGVITGTYPTLAVGTSETFYFDITATDEEDQDVTRSFTLTTNIDVVTWVTPSSGSTIQLDGTAYSQALTASDAASYSVSYTANSLPTGLTLSSGTISGTPTEEGTTSTLLTATAATTGRSAENTITWVVSLNDTYFKYNTLLLSANASSQTSSIISDNSINNNQLIVAGDTRATNFNPYQPGYYSYSFTGSSSYVLAPLTSALALTSDYTIECWVYFNAIAQQGIYSSIDASADTWQGPHLEMYTNYAPRLICYTSGGSSVVDIVHQTAMSAGRWYHIAAVRLNNTTYLYLNGVRSSSSSSDSTSYTQSGSIIGGSYPGTLHLNGYVSNFRITKTGLYSGATFTVPTTPLLSVTNTQLLTCQSNSFTDVSPNNLTITPTSASVSSANPFATQYAVDTQTYSYYLNGSSYLQGSLGSSITIGTNDFCFEAWGYWTSFNNGTYGAALISLYGASAGELMIRANKTSASSTSANWFNIVGGSTYIPSSMFSSGVSGGTLYLNRWHHLAVSRRSGTWNFYVDGQRVSTTSAGDASLTLPFTTVYVGSDGSGGGGYLTGLISNARLVVGSYVYDGASFAVPSAALTAITNTKLLTAQDSTFKDNSGYTTYTFTQSSANIKPVATSPFTPAYYSNYFNATSTNYLSVGANAAFNLSTSDFSIEFWVKPIAAGAYSALLSFDSTGDYPLCFYWGSSVNSGNIIAAVGTTSAWFANTSAITFGTTTTGQWTHILLTRSGDTWRSFQDGVLRYYATQSGTVGDCSTVYIGNNGTSTTYRSAQNISNLRIIKGSIPTDYQTSSTTTGTTVFTPSTSPLTTTSQGATASDVSLLTCQSQYFIDNSLNNFTVTPGASPVIAAVAPFTQPTGYTSTQITTYGSGYFANTGASNTSWILGPTLPAFGTTDHTIEFWMYQVAKQTYATVWRYAGGATQQATNDYYISTGAGGGSILVGGGGSWTVSLAFTVPSDNTWHHYALTRSGTSWKIYIDGVLANTASGNPTLATPGSAMVIGTSAASAANGVYVQGYISDFRIVLGTVLYTTNFLPQFTSPLTNVTNTQLLTLQSNGNYNNSRISDNSRFNNVLTKNGNPTNGTFSPYGDNWSVYFNGSTDYLSMPTATSTAMGSGFAGSTWTLECWVNVSAYSSSNSYFVGILGSYAAVGANGRWALTITGSAGGTGTPGFSYTTGTASQNDRSSSITISRGTWNHLAVTIDATTASTSTIKLYVNGQLGYSGSSENMSTQTVFYSAPVVGGGMGSGYWNYLNGYMSNVRIVKGTIIYPSVFTPPTTPLVLGSYNASMLVCSSNAFIDKAPVNATITVSGNPSIQKLSPFGTVTVPVYYSTYFNGTTDYITAPAAVTTYQAFNWSNTSWTIEGWFNFNSVAATKGLFAYPDLLTARYDGTNLIFSYRHTPASAAWATNTTAYSLQTNTWYHIALVLNNGSMRCYVNGTAIGTANTGVGPGARGSTTGMGEVFIVGANDEFFFGSPDSFMSGTISNFRISSIAVYTGNFTVPTSPLSTTQSSSTNISALTAGQVTLLTCQDSTFIDKTTNGWTIATPTVTVKPLAVSPFTPTVSTTPVSYSPTVFGQSLYLDGVGDFLTAPNSRTFDLSTGAWTIECWFYQLAAKTATLFSLGATRWRLVVFSNLGGHFYFNNASEMTVPAGSFPLNQWNHFAVSCVGDGSSTNVKIFANGKWSTTGALTSSLDTTSTFYIGRNSDASGTTWDFNGYITDIRITKGQNLYNASYFPPVAPLAITQNTSFMANGNSGVLDATRTVDLETVADAKVTTFSPYNGSYYSNYFDGSSSYFTATTSVAFPIGTENFTVEMWLNKLDAWNSANRVIMISGTSGSFQLWVDSSTSQLKVSFNNGTTPLAYAATSISLGVWFHLAVVRSGNNFTMYVNGTSVATGTDSSSFTTPTSIIIGNYTSGTSNIWNGYISNLRIVRGTAIVPTAGGPTSPLTAVSGTSLLTCQTNKFVDNSTNAITLTTNGTPKVATQNPFQVNSGQSYYFDGTGDYLSVPVQKPFEFGSSDWTFETWVYLAGVSAQQSITYLNANSSGYAAFNLQVQSGALNLWMSSTGSSWSLQQSSIGSISSGVWTHIAVTKSTTTMKVYINGSQAGGNYSVAQSLMATYTLNQIGVYNTSSYLLTGYLTDLRLTIGTERTISVPTTPYKTN